MCRRPLRGLLVAALSSGMLLAARPVGAITPRTLPPHDGDGVLTIGILLPQTGEGSLIGNPGVNAAEYAVARINEHGGFGGEDVVLVKRDEGDSATTASAAIEELVAVGVDAVVGPASSAVALQTLDELMGAGVLTCSPTATSLLLDDYPDRDLFFRTIPSDSLQMATVALVAQRSGYESAVMLYVDDQYGQGLAAAAQAELTRREVELVDAMGFGIDDDLSPQIEMLTRHHGSTIIVLADSEQGMRMLEAIAAAAPRLGGDALPPVLVNDAVRPADPERYRALGQPLLSSLQRLAPVAYLPAQQLDADARAAPPDPSEPADPPLPVGPFALNTLDCINLITLSAIDAGSDAPANIAAFMRATANSGAPCATFQECTDLAEQGRDIDYGGGNQQSNLYFFSPRRGDLARAVVMAYAVDPETGLDEEVGPYITDAAQE